MKIIQVNVVTGEVTEIEIADPVVETPVETPVEAPVETPVEEVQE
jgi:hypothetical protein